MYIFAVCVQIVAILFCAIGTFFLYSRIDKTVFKNLLASCVFATIFGIGYLMEMLATDEGSALYALITQYIGLSCVALFFAAFTTELFNYFKMPKIVWALCFCFNLSTFVCVLTSNYHNLYYKERVFVQDGLFPHLETKNSPWFYIFMVLLFLMMFYSAAIFIIGLIKSYRKKYNFWSVTALVFGIGFMWTSFAVGFNGYEPISSIVCIILGITSLVMMGSKSSAIINQAYADSYMNSSIGQIIITKDNRFLECNKMAMKFYPPFEFYHKGQTIKWEGENIIVKDNKLHVGEKCYAITYHKLEGNGKDREGQILFLTDVTVLEKQRTVDVLTGLYNRQAYFDRISSILTGEYSDINVLIADMNGLKTINDNLGHAEGDNIIKITSECMKKAFAENSYAFRFGGDEFVIISTADEKSFAEKVSQFNRLIENENNGRSGKISISYGISHSTCTDGIDIESLMKAADKEMYLNKKKYYESNHIERRHV